MLTSGQFPAPSTLSCTLEWESLISRDKFSTLFLSVSLLLSTYLQHQFIIKIIFVRVEAVTGLHWINGFSDLLQLWISLHLSFPPPLTFRPLCTSPFKRVSFQNVSFTLQLKIQQRSKVKGAGARLAWHGFFKNLRLVSFPASLLKNNNFHLILTYMVYNTAQRSFPTSGTHTLKLVFNPQSHQQTTSNKRPTAQFPISLSYSWEFVNWETKTLQNRSTE